MVLDSCALVEIALQSEDGRALQSFCAKGESMASCELVRAEVASVFRKMTRTLKMPPVIAEEYFMRALAVIDEFYPIEDLQSEALRESIRLDHSTYDMFYFVLARRTGATLLTLDRKLIDLCLRNGVDCVYIIDNL